VLFKSIDHINESVGNISFSVIIGTHFDGKGSLVVIGGIIVPFSGFSINILSWVRLG
jgi:hypothetical protein